MDGVRGWVMGCEEGNRKATYLQMYAYGVRSSVVVNLLWSTGDWSTGERSTCEYTS